MEESPPRIVLIEDEQLIAMDITRRLEKFGYRVVGHGSDGESAVELVKRLTPDLVLLDVRLPGELDGIDVAEALQKEVNLPVIFVTGNADDVTLQRAGQVHPFNTILKPIRDRELKISIDAALHHHRLAAELRASRDLLEQRVKDRTAELQKSNHLLQSEIAEHIVLQRELRHARAMAEASSKSKSCFFANISHEIRTPMNGIVGMADVLSATSLDSEQQNCLHVMKTCASTLLATIDEIIEFSELEAGKIQLASIRVDLRELLPAVLNPLEIQARAKGVELTCDIAPEVPLPIFIDPVRLGQIVMHLVQFCLKRLDTGEIEVQCERLAEAGGRAYLHFSVRDTSGNTSPELQKRVQQVFNQTDVELRDVEDIGLGLAIPSMLAHLMDAILWMECIPDIGNMFHLAIWVPTTEPINESSTR